MIFVTLGTQDKSFERLLKAIEESGIEGEIVAQTGYTKFESSKMKIFEYLNKDEFGEYLNKADVVISHAGVGTLLDAVIKGKTVIACPRLKKYGEHTNDHQLQITNALYNEGYVLRYLEGDYIEEVYKKALEFKPKAFVSNNNAFVSRMKDYLEL